MTECRAALRVSRPELSWRSVRRGALQQLAASGCSEAELLTFSRHTNVQQLRRYLSFGAIAEASQQSAIVKAAALAAGLRGGHSDDDLIRVTDWLHISRNGAVQFAPERAPPSVSSTVPCDRDCSDYVLHAKDGEKCTAHVVSLGSTMKTSSFRFGRPKASARATHHGVSSWLQTFSTLRTVAAGGGGCTTNRLRFDVGVRRNGRVVVHGRKNGKTRDTLGRAG